MQMNITINMDDIFSDMLGEINSNPEFGCQYPETNVEERVKGIVIDSVLRELTNKFTKTLNKDLEDEMKKALDEKIKEELTPTIEKSLQEFLEKKRVVVNSRWGNPTEYSTLEYIGMEVDKMLNETIVIDGYGREKDTRINHLLEGMVKKIVKDKFDKIQKEQTIKITKALEEAIAEKAKGSALKGLDLEAIAIKALELN